MITGSAGPALPSFLPFYFRIRAFLQRARLSRSLEQANKVCVRENQPTAYYLSQNYSPRYLTKAINQLR